MGHGITLREATAIEKEINRSFQPPTYEGIRAQVRAFVLGAKPAVYCDSHTAISRDAVVAGCRQLPFRHHVVLMRASEVFIANIDAVEERVRAQPELARLVGWRTDEAAGENIERLVNGTDETGAFGFILGFPRRAVTEFRQDATYRLLRFLPLPVRRLVTPLVQRANGYYRRRRIVEISDPDGNRISGWFAYGDPDPEEAIIAAHVLSAYDRE